MALSDLQEAIDQTVDTSLRVCSIHDAYLILKELWHWPGHEQQLVIMPLEEAGFVLGVFLHGYGGNLFRMASPTRIIELCREIDAHSIVVARNDIYARGKTTADRRFEARLMRECKLGPIDYKWMLVLRM